MDDLIILVLGGHASRFNIERLKRWRGETPENEQYFLEIARLWELTAREPSTETVTPPSLEVILGAEVTSSTRPFKRRGRFPARWGLLAASLTAVAFGIRVVGSAGPEPTATYQAPESEILTVTLADGSFVRLAPGSLLEEFEVQDTRQVALHGRGFFAVSRDETRPFIVQSGPGDVRVMGTRFEVSEDEEGGMRTVVVEGRVAVSNSDGRVEIGAGEIAHVVAGSPPEASRQEDVYAILDWPQGLLVFQGTRLSHVAEEVSRHFQRPIVVGEEFGDRRITAWFGGETFEEVTESLCLVTNANCTPSANGMTIGLPPEAGSLQ